MQAEKSQIKKEPKVEFIYPQKPKRNPAKDSSNIKITVLCNLRQLSIKKKNNS